MAAARLQAFWNHPAGPKTSKHTTCWHPSALNCSNRHSPALAPSSHHSSLLCPAFSAPPSGLCQSTVHFWAPTFKWGISFANIADMQRPAEKVSTPQQCGEFAAPCPHSAAAVLLAAGMPSQHNTQLRLLDGSKWHSLCSISTAVVSPH